MIRATRHNVENIAEAVADPESLVRKPRKHKRSTSIEILSGRRPLLAINGEFTVPTSANPIVRLKDIAARPRKSVPQTSSSNMDNTQVHVRHETSLPGGKRRKNPRWFGADGQPREISSEEDATPEWFIPDMDNTRLDQTHSIRVADGWVVESPKLAAFLKCEHFLINRRGEVWSWTYPSRQFGVVNSEPFDLNILDELYQSAKEEIVSDEYIRQLAPRGRPRSITDYPIGAHPFRLTNRSEAT